MSLDMDKILKATIGDRPETIHCSFKKTVYLRQYETEVYEVDATVELPAGMSNAEKMLVEAITQAQLEYEIYCMLAYKEQVTQTEFANRKQSLVNYVQAVKDKAEMLLNKNLDYIFNREDTVNVSGA